MAIDKNDSSQEQGPSISAETTLEQSDVVGLEQKNARRKVLRNALIGGGAIISTNVLPDSWKKPLLNSVILPSHAQTSVGTVVMGGGTGIIGSDSFAVDDILSIFINEANADAPVASAIGGCLILSVEGSVATVDLTLSDGSVDTQEGTVSGTSIIVTELHSGYTVTATLDSATATTAASGSVEGFGLTGTFSVSSAEPVCAALTTTVSPTTTAGPTTTALPTTTPIPCNANPNANCFTVSNFSLSKSYWS
jgi:hypothetical protein